MGAPLDEENLETDPVQEESSREIQLRQGLLTAPISSLHPRPAVTVTARSTIDEAVRLMNQEKIGAGLGAANDRLGGTFPQPDVPPPTPRPPPHFPPIPPPPHTT